jgi:branched-subunit amino acid aminotransferase/4-amino-4-deoxychorismate lyase
MTALQDAVLLVLRAYEEAHLMLDRHQRRVLRSIIAAAIARDIVAEELDADLEEEAA